MHYEQREIYFDLIKHLDEGGDIEINAPINAPESLNHTLHGSVDRDIEQELLLFMAMQLGFSVIKQGTNP